MFKMLCASAVSKTESEKAQEKELIAQMSKAVQKARGMVEGQIKGFAEECKNYTTIKKEANLFVPKD
jgi:hypothetical protein